MKLTPEQTKKITELLKDCHLPRGLGRDEHEACSIAAINLALTGELKDQIPKCMSLVVGRWIIKIQDSMPDNMRNSLEWKSLLPLAAGTGRDKEKERCDLIISWMWETVLTQLQPIADKHSFGEQWQEMTTEKTADAAAAAAHAAHAAHAVAAAAVAAAYAAAVAATYAAAAAAAYAAAAAHAAHAAAAAYADAAFWDKINPCKLLKELCEI